MQKLLGLTAIISLVGCGSDQSTPGVSKDSVDISDVPPAVMETATAFRDDINFSEAERETRNGVIYYDLEGLGADGQEWELDIMQDGDSWAVVEMQRDIAESELPPAVMTALRENAPDFVTARIIESTQTDRRIVFEFFDADSHKHEVLWDGAEASYLTEEWVH
ncbi:hypothetical protein [Parvularcula sp. LCG005]|uniref:hypothetical protein n=1 Tax=Parvularcula sp. LCG005 TaxID=3078805 RepID=UPI0029430D96|nr:hypothetical protein [Parvularcula sp. LCG005]WOI52402.1 hypothetical protein RUI03_09595 [Parvularcula sp. LCG005]